METDTKESNEKRLRLRQDLHEEEAWERYEWECIGCKQSLTHIHFDNDALMPYLENPFSDQPSIPRHALLSEGDSPPTAQSLQYAECHQLLCNDCKYDIDDNATKFGQPQTPIRSSRYIKYDSFLYRFFPGLADLSGRKEFAGFETPRYWPTYRVRCTECKKWKEIRHYLNEDPDHTLRWFIHAKRIDLTEHPFLIQFTTCDQCIDGQGMYLSVRLALFPIWKQIRYLESWNFWEWPDLFGKLEPVDIEKSCNYLQSVRKEIEESNGKCGLNRERFRTEGLANFSFKLPDKTEKSLAELDEEEIVQKVETCLDYYIWLWRVGWYMLCE